MSEKAGMINGRFTKETITDAIQLWTQSSVSLIDIRHRLIRPDEAIQHYRMPASMLVLIYGGRASVKLDNMVFHTDRYGIFHGGKGTVLSVFTEDATLESYMVLYKADTPSVYKQELYRLQKQGNPFMHTYGFSPENPILLMEKMASLYDGWRRQTAIGQFHAKITFYQLVYAIYEQLEKGGIPFIEPDLVASAKRFLDEHYAQPISIQSLSERFPISGSQLSRLFKKREHKSLQSYLNEKRLDAAKQYLQHSNATIKEIAVGCGFGNELNFMRMFKKYYKLTPSDFRKKMIENMRNYDIDNDYHRHYNEKEIDRLAKFTGDGEYAMFGGTKSKEFLLAAAASLMLVLSACGSNGPAATTSPSPTATQQQSPSETAKVEVTESGTRIIKTADGDVEIPADPQRIVIQSMFAVGDILPFERSIVGIDKYFKEFSELDVWEKHWNAYSELGIWDKQWEQALGDVEYIALENLEGVLSLDPDLIIARIDGLSPELIDQYKKIAPTVFYDSRNMTMEESMDFLGEVFNMPERAEGLKSAYYAKVEEAKQGLIQAGLLDKKIVFIQGVEGKTPHIHAEKNRALVYEILGMHAPEIVETTYFASRQATIEGAGYSASLSFELLPEYLADADIIAYTYFDESPEAIQTKLADVPLWPDLPAVRNGNVYYYSVNDTMMNYDYASHLITLETFVDGLLQLPIAK